MSIFKGAVNDSINNIENAKPRINTGVNKVIKKGFLYKKLFYCIY